MKKATLHLSDLHLSSFINSKTGKKIESRIENEPVFLNSFFSYLKTTCKEMEIEVNRIIITGDLTNEGEEKEFQGVEKFLIELMKELCIEKENIFIIPGNHDINWLDLQQSHKREFSDREANSLHDIKFKYFKKFYDNFFAECKEEFIPDKAIVEIKLFEDEKLIFLLLNSVFGESYLEKDHFGLVNYDSLKAELEIYKEIIMKNKVITFIHHMPNKEIMKNADEILSLLSSYGINTFIYGHIHTIKSDKIENEELYYFHSVGSFGKKDDKITNSFSLIVEEEKNTERIKYKVLRIAYIENLPPIWQALTQQKGNSISFDFKSPLKDVKQASSIFPIIESISKNRKPDVGVRNVEKKYFEKKENKDFNEIIFEIIKSEKLLKTGHFHWGKKLKSHNWIDINFLLSKYEYLNVIKNSMSEILDNIEEKPNIVFGVGFEGNLIGVYVAMYNNLKYTYLPSPNREEHNKYEKNIAISDLNTIVIICPIVIDKKSIQEFIDYYRGNLATAKKIYFFSLFYTGKQEYGVNMFQEIDDRLCFFAVCTKIKTDICNEEISSCIISSEGMSEIFDFYSK